MSDSLIGVDLGHGETAVAVAAGTATTEPRILEVQGQRNIISAVALTSEGRTLIGEEALVANDVTSLRIRFKSRRLDDVETRNTIGAFVRRLAELIRASWNGPAEFIAGVPFRLGCSHPRRLRRPDPGGRLEPRAGDGGIPGSLHQRP